MSVQEMETVFATADVDGDGQVCMEEFVALFASGNAALKKLISALDTNKDGVLSKQEMQAAFKKFDTDKDGAIDANEMKNGLKAFGVTMSDAEMKAIFAMADVNGDGQVCMGEFIALLSGGNPVASINKLKNALDTNKDGVLSQQEIQVMENFTSEVMNEMICSFF